MKKRRLDLGLLQREVAEQIAANPWTVANWEKGRTVPEVRFVPKIIRFLGYNPFPAGNTMADELRAARRRLGLSQRKFAALLGVDPSTVWRWERWGRRPSAKLAKRLEHHLPPDLGSR